jgi:hypothetical protein
MNMIMLVVVNLALTRTFLNERFICVFHANASILEFDHFSCTNLFLVLLEWILLQELYKLAGARQTWHGNKAKRNIVVENCRGYKT